MVNALPTSTSQLATSPRLSVIVPVAAGDTSQLPTLLEQLALLPAGSEVIVCRAHGSTVTKASSKYPRVIDVLSPSGRARQMNVGAARAHGDWLWFLHVDSQFESKAVSALLRFVDANQDAIGYFELAFRDDGPRLARLNAWGANLRSRVFSLPFGDQGFILRRSRFIGLGGYDETVPCGEDHILVWQARQAGVPMTRLQAKIATSARKYARHGWLRTTLRHLNLTIQQAWPQWRRLRRQTR